MNLSSKKKLGSKGERLLLKLATSGGSAIRIEAMD